MTRRIAIITAIYGNYEATCKLVTEQVLGGCDFICFTDDANLKSNGWIIDTTPYHVLFPNSIDSGDYINSPRNNKHTFNISKYYKQSFHCIPRLREYDVVIWIDGTIEITNPYTTKIVADILDGDEGVCVVAFEHEYRSGCLQSEARASNFFRYNSTFWNNQAQPVQAVSAQYDEYAKLGYNDAYWKQNGVVHTRNTGVWITCFVAFDMTRRDKIIDFLNLWYLQTLKYTTQDQVGFPFALQKMDMRPYSFHDEPTPHFHTRLYTKHDHSL
jgi:hypothetical protein